MIEEQTEMYLVKINENNILRNGFVEGDTHILEIEVNHLTKEEMDEDEGVRVENQLRSTRGALYCKDGANESIQRTIGMSIE
jgi:hypothetical protein